MSNGPTVCGAAPAPQKIDTGTGTVFSPNKIPPLGLCVNGSRYGFDTIIWIRADSDSNGLVILYTVRLFMVILMFAGSATCSAERGRSLGRPKTKGRFSKVIAQIPYARYLSVLWIWIGLDPGKMNKTDKLVDTVLAIQFFTSFCFICTDKNNGMFL